MDAIPRLAWLFRLLPPVAAALLGALLALGEADAQEAMPLAGLEQQVQQMALAASKEGQRVEIEVGRLDPRLKLAPCARIDAYLPEGTRPWGRSRIGLRCAEGAVKWNVYLPIVVKVWGRALVAAQPIAAGAVLTAGDLAVAEVDLAEDGSPAVADAGAVVGRAATRGLRAGQSVRASHLKARQYFAAGDVVTVLATGPGYSVAGEGTALTNGYEGQAARVRTESGRVLTGNPTGERRLELD